MNAVTTVAEARLSEKQVLGSAMLDRAAYEACATIVAPSDFTDRRHEIIWNAISAVARTGGHDAVGPVPDAPLVIDYLIKHNELGLAGGDGYIFDVVHDVTTPGNAPYHADIVHEAGRRERAAGVGDRLSMARQPQDRAAVAALIGEATSALTALQASEAKRDLMDPAEGLEAVAERCSAGPVALGMKTGITKLDDILKGLVRGRMYVVGARPSVGKSIVGGEWAYNIAKAGTPCLFFTLEMSQLEMYARFLSNHSGITSDVLDLAEPKLTDAHWERLAQCAESFSALPLYVGDDPDLTPARLEATIAAMKGKHPDLGVVVVDFIQIMSTDSGRAEQISMGAKVTELSRALKLIAKRQQVAMVVLSQLNRKSEERPDKTPQLSDLRESGTIEQDADVVVLLHREDMYDPNSARAGEMDLLVEKNRHGRNKVRVAVSAQLHLWRIGNLAYDDDEFAARRAA